MSQPAYALPPGTMILGVNPGFTRKNTQKFDVQCSDGQTYTCFQPNQASKAQALAQQQGVTIMVSRSDDGRYQNFEDAFPGGGAAPGGFQQPGFNPAAAQSVYPPQSPIAQPAQFTPAVGFVDQKQVEARRGYAVAGAANLLAPLVGTGFYNNDEGTALDIAKVAADLVSLSGIIARYAVEGPSGGTGQAQPSAQPAAAIATLPPGVTPEQVAQWVASQGEAGAAVQVGAPVPTAEPEATTAY